MTDKPNIIDVYGRIRSILQSEGFDVSPHKEIDYGLQFLISTLSWSGVIRIYQNKKGIIKVDYSQLKGIKRGEIQQLLEGKDISPRDRGATQQKINIEFPVIGTDESGKGDYFGPLVSAGVYVDEASARKLGSYGVTDSKNLKDNRNLDLARRIESICKERFSIIEISPEKYNSLYEQFKKENKNLNTLLAWGHAKAIEEILSKVDCNLAVADQFADESFIISKLQEKGRKLQLIQMPKAEQNIAVAAASVLARARFLQKLSKLSSEYKIDLPKGVSRTVIETANKFVSMHGKESLRKVAKLHFKTTRKVIME